MSSDPDPGLEKQYKKKVLSALRLARLPASNQDVAVLLTRTDIERAAQCLGIEGAAEALEGLRGISLPNARERVRRELVDLRHRAVSSMLSNAGNLRDISEFVAWGSGQAPLPASGAGLSSDASAPGDASFFTRGSSSGDGSHMESAAALEIADLRAKVNALLEERDVPLDGEDDRSAGGRRLILHDRTLGLLPDDIYRQELLKGELAKILRSYPLPKDLRLRGGVLSLAERAKLSASQRVEHDALGATIADFSSILRPLLALLNFTESHESAEAHGFFEEIRPFILSSFDLLFHHCSIRERKRREIMFADQPILQQVFQKPIARSMLNAVEQQRIDAIYETEKHAQKLQKFLKPKSSTGSISKNPSKQRDGRQSYGTRKPQASFTPSKPGAGSSAQSPFRPSKGKGVGRGRGRSHQRNGEASGPREASAQQE